MQRILRRRSDPHEQADEQPTHASEQPTTQLPASLPEEQTTPTPPPSAPSFRDRGRLRRRLRYLRRARELGFRDLGGLVFDLRRFDRDRPDLVQAKLDALAGTDQELRALETALDQRTPIHELREPGIASCPRCGALHATDARFCAACGTGLRGPRTVVDVGGGAVQRSVGLEAGGANGGAAPATGGPTAEGDRAAGHVSPAERGPVAGTESSGAESVRPESTREERPAERWPGSSP